MSRPDSMRTGSAKPGPDPWGGVLRDLQDLYLLASLVDITWTMVKQAGQGLRDKELLDVVAACDGQTTKQLKWLSTRMKQAAPPALLIAK